MVPSKVQHSREYRYDPFGRRISKTGNPASLFIYDGANLLEQVNASTGAVIVRYTQGPGIDEPLTQLRGATTSYYHADGLGSITSLTNSSGVITDTYTYDAYGNLRDSSGTTVNNIRYTGREFDSETGLYYYRARYYDPSIGRFLSEDPIGFNGGRISLCMLTICRSMSETRSVYKVVWGLPSHLSRFQVLLRLNGCGQPIQGHRFRHHHMSLHLTFGGGQ